MIETLTAKGAGLHDAKCMVNVLVACNHVRLSDIMTMRAIIAADRFAKRHAPHVYKYVAV